MKTIDEIRETLVELVKLRKTENIQLAIGLNWYNEKHDGKCFACLLGCVTSKAMMQNSIEAARILDIDDEQAGAIESGFEGFLGRAGRKGFKQLKPWNELGKEFRKDAIKNFNA